MSQSDFGNLESPLNGTTFFNSKLEPWRDALHSTHKGSSRPSYATAGMLWINDTTNPWVLNGFTGSVDVPLGTINTSTGEFTPSNVPTQWGGSTGGTANALTLTPTKALTAYATGTTAYDALITTTNTASAPTLNISSQGNKTIKVFLGAGKVNAPIGSLQAGMIARFIYDGTDIILTNPRWNNPATAVASASTLNLDTATGDYVEVTGTTTITAITLANGLERTVKFSGVLTITDGASLITPQAQNIDTYAGDVMVVRGEPSGVVRIVSYMRFGGQEVPLIPVSAARTLVASDANKILLHPSADTTARTWTVPANSSVPYKVGTLITMTNQNGAGDITIAITTDTMRLAGPGTTGNRTLKANGTATLQKVTSTEWLISGVNLT